MPLVRFPYGKTHIEYDFPQERLRGCLISALEEYVPAASGAELIAGALKHPIGGTRLSELAAGKQKVVILASDHTRPVPSKLILPPMLREIRAGNPGAQITILVATGCHRGTTADELREKFGEDILRRETIVIHDCDAPDAVTLGTLPSGGKLVVNRLAAEADLLVAEGFIEPHFFAGFSGGRKSLLPGVAARSTVLYNHSADF
ncbi:MAG: lactate racemase domain-containing protein, partial [Oscillospiraceae bacterium]|nr:lactate racemase domain-containing protein [Oscillospiraceae bacterium]